MCYCGNSKSYEQCCQPYHLKSKAPTSAEELMRSRYSAYCLADVQYIFDTYASSKQKDNSLTAIAAFAQACQFIKLEVLDSETDMVEFKAHYIQDEQYYVLHERSNFSLEAGHWRYVDGELFPCDVKELSRNSQCPCGSGKKFKRCHRA